LTHEIVQGKSAWEVGEPLHLRRSSDGCVLAPAATAADLHPEAVAAFLPDGRRGIVLVADACRPASVNGVPVRGGLQRLRDGDRVDVDGIAFAARFSLQAREGAWTPPDGIGDAAARCAVCRADFREGDAVVWCGACEAAHHRRCFQARSSRCGRYGCLAVTHIGRAEQGD
jgi:hypothetical protein